MPAQNGFAGSKNVCAMGSTLYEQDFYAWTREQAERLRGLCRTNDLDIENLAEEVEALGRSERDAVRSQIRRLIEHLLKLRHSTARDLRAGWRRSVIEARARLDDKMSPSLRADVEASRDRLFAIARRLASADLERHGETPILPERCPYALDDMLAEDFFPEPEAHRED
jgi:Domain of unknown function DUF29